MQGQYTMNAGTMNEQDLFHNILILLKHNAREYATAVTESNCAVVRQTMQRLLHETLAEQADCYQVMSRQGWYPSAPVATRQDVQKSVQQHRQSAQNTAQTVQMTGIRPTYAQSGQFQNPLQQQQPIWQPQQQLQQHQPQHQPQGQSWQATAQHSPYSQAQYQPVMQHNPSQPSDLQSANSVHAGTLEQNAHITSGEAQDWHHFSRTTGEATH